MEKQSLKTSEYVVAFIDVLGANEMIRKNVDDSLNIIHTVYEDSLKLFEKKKKKIHFEISIFSDNIVIAKSITEDYSAEKCLYFIQVLSAIVQVQFLTRGILVRGGIACGSFYKDNIMIWGTGLTRAYYLENTVAIYPRIVIDPDFNKHIRLDKESVLIWPFFMKRDIDGLLFVDYLQEKLIPDYDLFLWYEFAKHDDRVKVNGSNISVLQKINWHNKYVLSKIENGEEENEQKDK